MNGSAAAGSSLRAEAEALARAGRHRDAVQRYRTALSEQPECGESLLGLGRSLAHLGQFQEATAALERACRSLPTSAPARCVIAEVARRQGQTAEALTWLQHAVELDSGCAPAWTALGKLLRQVGRLPEAVGALQRAVLADGRSAVAWSVLSNALRESERFQEAVHAAEKALSIHPLYGPAHLNMGCALHRCQQPQTAAAYYAISGTFTALTKAARANWQTLHAHHPTALGDGLDEVVPAIVHDPGSGLHLARLSAWAHNNGQLPLAIACAQRAAEALGRGEDYEQLARLSWAAGHLRAAETQALEAVSRQPDRPSAFQAWAGILAEAPRSIRFDAERRALAAVCPENWDALRVLSVCARERDQPSLSLQLADRALAHNPEDVALRMLRCGALGDLGRFAEATAGLRSLLRDAPELWAAHSQWLFSLHFDSSRSLAELRRAHEQFGARVGTLVERQPAGATTWQQSLLSREAPSDGAKRLVVGYLSPDLRRHPVAYLLEAVLRHHDHNQFEVICLSDTRQPDDITERVKGLCGQFVDTSRLSAGEFVDRVRALQCDLVVELAGHTRGNRLVELGHRVAPVQCSWLGYFNTTGLATMDYRLADAAGVPSGAESAFVEQVIRLPRTSNCFLPGLTPPLAPLPWAAAGKVTFGSFNNPAKISRRVVAAWGEILRRHPSAQLLLMYGTLEDPQLVEKITQWFAEESIDPARLAFRGHAPLREFLEAVSSVDIALDPFPYSGETTALYCLWMGVPVVALEGQGLVQRLASRVLRVAGLDRWVAQSEADYVALAGREAAEPERLQPLRASLRAQLQQSPLMDYEPFVRQLEAAFRAMMPVDAAPADG